MIFNRVNTLTNDYSIYNVRQKVITHAPRYLLDFVIIFAVFVMIFILQLIYNQKLIEYVPLISVFAFAAIRFIPSSNIIIRGISNIRFGKNTVERLYNDLKLSNNIEQSYINTDDSFINLKLKNISFLFQIILF